MPLENQAADESKNMIIIDASALPPSVGDNELRQHN